jgi:hypothetical protein
MLIMLHRRSLLRGLFAAPAVVAVSSLMPIRGIVMDTLILPYIPLQGNPFALSDDLSRLYIWNGDKWVVWTNMQDVFVSNRLLNQIGSDSIPA